MSKTSKLHIGYNAKRAFFNRSGLGNYSRDLIIVLSQLAPENHCYLFKREDIKGVDFEIEDNVSTILPRSAFYKRFGKLWQHKEIAKDIRNYPIDIFHDLSQEMPLRNDDCRINNSENLRKQITKETTTKNITTYKELL